MQDLQSHDSKALDAIYPEYDIEYPNYKLELRERQVQYSGIPQGSHSIRYQRIPMCGHKFVPQHEPQHRNCHACWLTFFQVHGEFTQALEELYAKGRSDVIITLKGKKVLKNFLKFMATVAAYRQALEINKEKNVPSVGRIEGSDESV